MPGANAAEQAAVIAFLADPATHGGAAVERVTTHGAIVFLAGDRAWKLKRAVRFPYMDFSTLDLRHAACMAELTLNRRTAPEIYLDVVAVTRRADGGLALGGDGAAVDWLVAMRRFPSGAVLDRVADRGGIDDALADAIADHVAAFHAGAELRPDGGGVAAMRRVIDVDDAAFAACAPHLPRQATEALGAESRRRLEALGPLLERRRRDGRVRLGHGDLHLGNICLLDGRPRLFDALEFDERLITIDVLYDVAFLVMDLWARGLHRAAHRVLGRYVERSGELEGLALMPLFLSIRAAIRAHVAVAQGGADAGRRARAYLALAVAALEPAPPRLVAVGGLSGSGKSTLALALARFLAPIPGAVVLRSDVVRKRLAGLDPAARAGPEAYAPERTRQVYDTLRREAATALAAGRSAIVDAVHADPAERAAVEAVARRLGVPFDGIWLAAPGPTLVARVEARRGDASDADAAVVHRQLGYDLGAVAWPALEGGADPHTVLAAARRMLDMVDDPDPDPAGAPGH